jgi:hypothetical protein
VSERWTWIVRYVIVILLAVILAAVMGDMALFKATKFGKSGLNAARIVQFLGYSGALAVFWLLAQRAAALLDPTDPRWSTLKIVVVPAATLVVVASGQAAALLVLAPLLGKAGVQIYNWIAVLAIVVSAAWLLAALFIGSAAVRRQERL